MSIGAESWRIWWTVAGGIPGKVVLGFCRLSEGFGGEMWVVFAMGRKGRVAGDVGEIRGWIPSCSGGVLGVGFQGKEEAEVLRLWSISEEERGLSLAGDHSGKLCLSGMNSQSFLLSLLPDSGLTSPPFCSEF